jgi:hypothetical protein
MSILAADSIVVQSMLFIQTPDIYLNRQRTVSAEGRELEASHQRKKLKIVRTSPREIGCSQHYSYPNGIYRIDYS